MVTVVISFLLEGVFSNFVSINGFFVPLFTLTSLIIIYPFSLEKEKYYKYAFITGLMYDLFYTDTIVFHAIIFCLIAYIVVKFNLVLSDNYINELIILILCILIYRTLTYSLLVLIGNLSFDIYDLLFSFIKSLSSNLIYGIILFFIIKNNKKSTHQKNLF